MRSQTDSWAFFCRLFVLKIHLFTGATLYALLIHSVGLSIVQELFFSFQLIEA